jgi:hypothetical protein
MDVIMDLIGKSMKQKWTHQSQIVWRHRGCEDRRAGLGRIRGGLQGTELLRDQNPF